MQSRSKPSRACARCHERKIRCDGASPSCRNCMLGRVTCKPHERRRRVSERGLADAERLFSETAQRLAWLEDEIHRVFKVDTRQVKTGMPLDNLVRNTRVAHGGDNAGVPTSAPNISQTPGYGPSAPVNEDWSEEGVHRVDPDISILALNATGEVRYLGASSGSFFAKYIANVACSLSSRDRLGSNTECPEVLSSLSSERAPTSIRSQIGWNLSETFPFLLRCYMRWVHSIYPLFQPWYITRLESMCTSNSIPQDHSDTTVIFYLVMSLGAVNAEQPHLLKEIRGDLGIPAYHKASNHGLSAEALYWKAMNVLDFQVKALTPRISVVQILDLISIYASHRPSENKQWHVGGIAMRLAIELGLHRHNDNWKLAPDELELRRKVFWTTYAIEITLAFNLGRPAGISFEDADVPFPEETGDMIMAIHHVRHRQIQEQMLVQVYRKRKNSPTVTTEACQSILDCLQEQLDRWHQDLPGLHRRSKSPYPVEYWERLYYSTSASLSRPTPLVPRPGPQSHEQCFLFSGQVIEIHHELVRRFYVPNSWMLLQGLTLSAVSMIVTARANTLDLARRIGIRTLLDRMNEWTRKLSIVMAVMKERWVGSAFNSFDSLLDTISRDTVSHIINIMLNSGSQLERSAQNIIHSEAPLLPDLDRSQDPTLAQPSTTLDRIQYAVEDSADYATEQHTLTASHQLMDSGFPGLDSSGMWESFDNLFEASELETFFALFPGQQYNFTSSTSQ